MKPVDPAHVVAVLSCLSRHIRVMVQLQRLTGMRPGEVCGFSFAEVDRGAELWVYRPSQHKTAHRGKPRAIPLGPKARTLLQAFVQGDHPPPSGVHATSNLNDPNQSDVRLVAAVAYEEAERDRDAELLRDLTRPVVFLPNGCVVDPAAPVFSPAVERAERFKRLRAARKTKVPPSQLARKKKNPQLVPSARVHWATLNTSGHCKGVCERVFRTGTRNQLPVTCSRPKCEREQRAGSRPGTARSLPR